MGHAVLKEGIKVNPDEKTILEQPKSIDNIGTRKFFSLVYYYRRVMKELSKVAFSLINA